MLLPRGRLMRLEMLRVVILSSCHLVIQPLDHGWRNVMGREERGWRCIYDNTDEAQIPKYTQWCHHL